MWHQTPMVSRGLLGRAHRMLGPAPAAVQVLQDMGAVLLSAAFVPEDIAIADMQRAAVGRHCGPLMPTPAPQPLVRMLAPAIAQTVAGTVARP